VTQHPRTLTTLSLAAALLVGASSAHAEMKVVSRAGVWTVSAGTADIGRPMCSMTTTSGIRSVYVKWMLTGFFVHLGKDNWKVPAGVEMPLSLRFDQDAPFKGTAKGHFRRPKLIELNIDAADTRRFIDEFGGGDRMTVTFSGNEPEWVLRMDGSDTVATKFAECIAAVNKKYGGRATQPFDTPQSDASPSQPWLPSPQKPATPPSPKKVPTVPYKVTPRGYEQQEDTI
jgi:hypothetical protein